MALVPWSGTYWSSRKLAAWLMCIRTINLVLATAAFFLFFTSLIVLNDDINRTELYRCIVLSLAIAFAYSLSLFTRSTPPPFWRLGWCISGIIQAIGYTILLRRSQERWRPYFPGYVAYHVNLAGVIVLSVAIIFIAIDAYVSHKTQQDKVIREPLLKNFLMNRVFVHHDSARQALRRRRGSVRPAGTAGSSSGTGAAGAGSTGSAAGDDQGANANRRQDGPDIEIVLGSVDQEIHERQQEMIRQQIRTQQRENWFLSPRIVASPDFNLADHHVALEPLPLYEPPADGVYVPPPSSQQQPSPPHTPEGRGAQATSWPATGLPRRPPPAAIAGEPAPPSYDALHEPQHPPTTTTTTTSPSPPEATTTAVPVDQSLSSPQAPVVVASSTAATTIAPPPPPPPHGGQLPPAYDDLVPLSSTAPSPPQPARIAQ